MSREFDRRITSGGRAAPARAAALAAAAEEGPARPGATEIPIDTLATGAGAAALGAAPLPEQGSPIQRAIAYARGLGAPGAPGHARAFSASPGDEPPPQRELLADPAVQRTSSGASAVHLQQLHKGIPIFQASQVVQFDPSGAIEGAAGQAVDVADDDAPPAPAVRPEEALLTAARYLAEAAPDDEPAEDQFKQPLREPPLILGDYRPQITAAFPDKADAPTVFTRGPFGAAPKASLTWLPIEGQLHLAYEFTLAMPDLTSRYRVLVDALDNELLYCQAIAHYASARGNVHAVDGASARQRVDFPLPPATYGLPIPAGLPPGFPGDWVDNEFADGNNALTSLGDTDQTVRGKRVGGVVEFNPADPLGNGQRLLNAFYFVNRAHDFFYLLGFRERDGSFQRRNLSAGGAPSDPVDVRVYEGFVNGTATMLTLVDGTSPVMRLGAMPNALFHTALDSSVVYHEYTHGVSNRLVGGPLNVRALEAAQSQALGEALSDFFACIMNRTTVVGAWVMQNDVGIRTAPYDSGYPGHFGMLGRKPYTKIHGAGEIYCAALMELSRAIDPELCAQLVIDSLRLVPANPTFLQARDALLRAIDHMLAAGAMGGAEHREVHEAAWRAFTRFGMGPGAQAPSALTLSGVTADLGALEAGLSAPHDDLTLIEGIDQGVEQRLQAAEIRTFEQLAATTPARLARVIARSGINAQYIIKSGWIERARKLAGERGRAGAPTPEPEPAAPAEGAGPQRGHERQRPTSFTVRLNLGAENSVQKTEVIHARDGERSEWAGWNEQRLIDFIRRHTGLDEPAPAAITQRLDGAAVGLDDAGAAPSGQAAGADPAGLGAAAGRLEGETVKQPAGADLLRLRLRFEPRGALGQPEYVWEIVADELETGQRALLGREQGRLAPDGAAQEIDTVVDLPPVGRYRLSSTLLIPAHRLFIHAPGPMLRVEPPA